MPAVNNNSGRIHEMNQFCAMLIHEYRVILPMTVEQYQVAQLYTIADMSRSETGGGEGIEILKNEPFSNHSLLGGMYTAGQYTLKIYHVQKKIPTLIKLIVPKGSLKIYEECWNTYPYSKTVLTNPGLMKDGFELTIESLHLNDRGEKYNVHHLPPELLKQRQVTTIDIANDNVGRKDYDPSFDPKTFHSEKSGQGPLTDNWLETVTPVMTCYKLVTANFKWFGLQRRVEKFLQKFEQRLFTVFHRRLFCLSDQWYDLTMADVRDIEEESKVVLDREMKSANLRGTSTYSF
uniref:Phosphatidylinositol transfer protein N-terminal domain-containing protein n=1 Tax=Cuerna arida TaxID=1464854 RepID=A0A1B6ER29_9HEMI